MKSAWIATSIMIAALIASPLSHAQLKPAAKGEFQPYLGQPGKDVVWVPTPESVVNRMLDLAKVTPQDFLVDLGSGDGRTVITAAKRGARAMGVEYNPDMVALSNREAIKAGVTDRVKFVNGDIFATDFSQATVITLYLLPSLNLRLRPAILEMKAGTRVASHAFNMAEWEPDETANIEGRQAYLWIVPAKVTGTWNLNIAGQTRELALQQNFQMLSGSAKAATDVTALVDARLRGDEIRFAWVERGTKREFTGQIQGSTMNGMVKTAGQPDQSWTATKR
jgi:SAM-dependent methyltransferase